MRHTWRPSHIFSISIFLPKPNDGVHPALCNATPQWLQIRHQSHQSPDQVWILRCSDFPLSLQFVSRDPIKTIKNQSHQSPPLGSRSRKGASEIRVLLWGGATWEVPYGPRLSTIRGSPRTERRWPPRLVERPDKVAANETTKSPMSPNIGNFC